jgi:hypothetical protein
VAGGTGVGAGAVGVAIATSAVSCVPRLSVTVKRSVKVLESDTCTVVSGCDALANVGVAPVTPIAVH